MNLPGYDEWKLASPYEMTAAQEAEAAEAARQKEDNLRECIALVLTEERGDIYLAVVRQIVVEELNKLSRLPGEPVWQTKTPVPIPKLG